MNKYKTKECHQCGYTIIQSTNSLNGKPDKNDANMLLSLCPFCNEVFFDGEIEGVAGCKTILENQIYAQYIFGHTEKEKLYQERKFSYLFSRNGIHIAYVTFTDIWHDVDSARETSFRCLKKWT